MKYLITIFCFLFAIPAQAQEPPKCPEPYDMCLTKEQKDKVVKALKELKDIKESEAEVTFEEDIVIIRDWEDRVYVNGGEKKPVKMKLKLGETIDRDMEAQLPIKLSYREEPPDPPFRFRLRAQLAVMVPELVTSIRDEEFEIPWDFSVGLDFLHFDALNLAGYIGTLGFGLGAGVDLTKNFGAMANFMIRYDGFDPFEPTMNTGIYFAFN
jgi:hypothetical protein